MNVNPLIEGLSEATGLDVSPDIYEGEHDKYIVYTYEDERPVNWGDGRVHHNTVWVNVSLYTPKHFNHMALKHKIRDYLESNGFIVSDIRSFLETYANTYIRNTSFSVTYTEHR